MISPVLLFNLVIGCIHATQLFVEPLVMTNGGPNNATLTLLLYLYRNAFSYLKMGYAAAIALIMFLLTLGLTVPVPLVAALGVLRVGWIRRPMSSGVLASVIRGKPIGLRVRKTRYGGSIVYLLLLFLVAVALLPLLWMVFDVAQAGLHRGVQPVAAALQGDLVQLSRHLEPRAVSGAARQHHVHYRAALFGSLLSASITGFAFARLRFPGRDVWFAILIMTMLIPPAIMIIPQYLLFNWLRWIDSYKPLIVPWFFGGGAFRIFLFRQFIKSIPEELDQAAEIDGCSTFRIFGQIIVPLMMPAVATVAVLGFMDFWNDFFAPFIYLNNIDKDTIVLRLFRIWSDAEGYMREELHTIQGIVTSPEALHPGHRHHRHQGLTASLTDRAVESLGPVVLQDVDARSVEYLHRRELAHQGSQGNAAVHQRDVQVGNGSGETEHRQAVDRHGPVPDRHRYGRG